MEKIGKKKSHAFKKDVYLLGLDEAGIPVWLESPSWDCGWYWGFGYIEQYTNPNFPNRSLDIQCHSHFESLVWFDAGHGAYVHHVNQSPKLSATVLSESESWELSDLMKRFYTLKEAAEIFHSGCAHLATSKAVDSKNLEMYEKINKEILPPVFARILEILTPPNPDDVESAPGL